MPKSHVGAADCLGAPVQANDNANGYLGVWLPTARKAQYTLTVAVNDGHAGISFFPESSNLVATVDGTPGSSRTFNSTNSIVCSCTLDPIITVVISRATPVPILVCPTGYGWLLQVDGAQNRVYNTIVPMTAG